MQQPEPNPPYSWAGRVVGDWVEVVVARPRWVLGMSALLLLVALAGVSRLTVDTDSSRMLSPSLPFQQRADALNAAFPALKNTLVVVVRAKSGDADAADAVVGALIGALSQRDDVFDWIFAPSANPYLVAHGLLYLDRDTLDERLSRLARSANLLAALRAEQSFPSFLRAIDQATQLAEAGEGDAAMLEPLYGEAASVLAAEDKGSIRPFGWSSVLAPSGTEAVTRAITLGPKLDFSALFPAKPALTAIQTAIAALDPALVSGLEIGVTGEPALRSDELKSVTGRIFLSLALSLVFVAVLLRLAFGSMARVGLALGALVVTLVLTAGFAALTVGALNLISIAFVVLMVGLGIDFAIHFIAHFDDHAAQVPDRRRALTGSARDIGAALVLSAATTSLAFFAFATTDFIGMAQLGLIGGAGVLIALAVALTVIPAAIMLWPGLAAGPRLRPLWQPPPAIRRGLFWLVLAIGLGAVALVPQSRFDADPMNLRDPDSASVRSYRWLAADPKLAPQSLNLLAETADQARAIVAALATVPQVRQTRWLGDLVPDDQDAKLDLIDLAYPSLLYAVEGAPVDLAVNSNPVTPQTLVRRLKTQPGPEAARLGRELAAYAERRSPVRDAALTGALFRYFPLLIDRLRLQLEAGEVTADELPAPLRARYLAADGRLRVEIFPASDLRDPAAMRGFVNAVAAADLPGSPGAAGAPDQITGAAGAVASAIMQAAALAFLGCALLAWAVLRNVLRVVAILLPLGLAGAVTMAAGVLLDLPFNYANVIVLPLLIGVGIDSGVHFSLRANNHAGSVFDTTTPRAVLYSALTSIAAFGTLGLSEHRGTASMGILLAISLTAALGMIFALTPALVRFSKQRERK